MMPAYKDPASLAVVGCEEEVTYAAFRRFLVLTCLGLNVRRDNGERVIPIHKSVTGTQQNVEGHKTEKPRGPRTGKRRVQTGWQQAPTWS